MNIVCKAVLVFLLSTRIGLAQSGTIVQKYLSLTPDFSKASLDEGRGEIPFTVRNNTGEDIIFMEDWQIALMTFDDAGKKVTIEDFQAPNRIRKYSGMRPPPITLKAGATGTYNSEAPMETLAFAAARKKKIFGEIAGRTVKTNRMFVFYSDPFIIPSELTKPPWNDLGKQNYLSIDVDSRKPEIDLFGDQSRQLRIPGIDYWGSLTFPIKITNLTINTFIVGSVAVGFCKGESEQKVNLWQLVRGFKPAPAADERNDMTTILKPSGSVMAGGGSYITLWNNPTEIGWKQGDQVVVAVVGRIPNTNKVFECYSAPFKFPPLPIEPPPKSTAGETSKEK